MTDVEAWIALLDRLSALPRELIAPILIGGILWLLLYKEALIPGGQHRELKEDRNFFKAAYQDANKAMLDSTALARRSTIATASQGDHLGDISNTIQRMDTRMNEVLQRIEERLEKLERVPSGGRQR